MASEAPFRRARRGIAVVPEGRGVFARLTVLENLPHHGQGANTTIEDAVTLAELIGARGVRDLDATLSLYRRLRRTRTRQIQLSSRATNDLLHLPDGRALAARKARMARFPDDFGWIHGFEAAETARAAARSVDVARGRAGGPPCPRRTLGLRNAP